MKIGFLHLGPETHGVRRFGERLSHAMKGRTDTDIFEWSFQEWNNTIPIDEINQKVDLLYCQYNAQAYSSIWGRLGMQVKNLFQFSQRITIPVVFTLHDIYQPGYQSFSNKFSFVEAMKFWISPQRKALKLLSQYPVIVNSKEEARRLNTILFNTHSTVIPHFIEKNTIKIDKLAAKKKLGLRGKKVIIILGFIHPRKGHDIAVKTMRYLEKDYLLLIAGGSVNRLSVYEKKITELIIRHGLRDRVKITGYLSDDKLAEILSAADVAILPCRNVSASGSLMTLLANNIPVVTSDLPLFNECNQYANEPLLIFPELNARSMAQFISNHFESLPEQIPKIEAFCNQMKTECIVEKYINVFDKTVNKSRDEDGE